MSRQEQREQPQRMHRTQGVGGVRLQKSLLQVKPQLSASRRSRCERRQGLFDAVFGGGTQLESVMRHEVKQAQQNFGILQSRGLLQKDQSVNDRKIRCGNPRAPTLYLAIERRPGLGDLFEQLRHGPLHRAGVAEIDSHPVGSRKFFGTGSADLSSSSGVLRFPTQRVVVASMTEMQEAAGRHQEVNSRLQLFANWGPQGACLRPVVELVHRGNQGQPVGDVAIAESAGSFFYVWLEVIQGHAMFGVAFARNLGQSLQQGFGFAHDELRDDFVVQSAE